MRYGLLIAYDGTYFAGSQRQKNARTVQGELEGALQQVLGAPARVSMSGRTDAGVHAAGQVAMFDGETPVPAHKLAEVISRHLPEDVKVLKSAAAPEGFDCTRAVRKKTYRYRFYCARTPHPLLSRYAARLEGEPDLAPFRATGSSAKTTVRTIFSLAVQRLTVYGVPVYEVVVTGNGFLYNMVRILAGELYAVGCAMAEEGDIAAAFATGERSKLYRTLPACGLTLEHVDYGISLFD